MDGGFEIKSVGIREKARRTKKRSGKKMSMRMSFILVFLSFKSTTDTYISCFHFYEGSEEKRGKI